ncbi:hypothetical protein [Streptomyces gilvus]|uniref:hypothetical protein n=1 Tax=Streptomyces gilvus TaxID=2920937 RepID=UPI001F111E1D|nr:hypothetical protein [Streptomyces sp. CME 23]MCH5674137.1 hypothetical protein [Streptomyces sp. CME 23]
MSTTTNGAGPRTSGAAPLPELEGEWENLYEDEGALENEFENEYEGEFEGEFEGEEFLSSLAGLAGRAARSALGSLSGGGPEQEYLFEAEDEFEEEFEEEGLHHREFEEEALHEYEEEGEFEYESEGMANPLRRIYPDALMEHLGHAAAEAESEEEAEAFIGALAPIAVGLVRRAAPAVIRHAPQLVRGLAGVTRTLRRSPATRPLVRALPTIAVRTTSSLARQVARGRPVTARSAARTLAGQTAAVLSDPRRRRAVLRRARTMDRRYHQAVRSGAPALAPVSAAAVRSVAAVPTSVSGPGLRGRPAVVPTTRRRYGPRRVAAPPAGLPALSIAWVPVPAYRPARPRRPYGF